MTNKYEVKKMLVLEELELKKVDDGWVLINGKVIEFFENTFKGIQEAKNYIIDNYLLKTDINSGTILNGADIENYSNTPKYKLSLTLTLQDVCCND